MSNICKTKGELGLRNKSSLVNMHFKMQSHSVSIATIGPYLMVDWDFFLSFQFELHLGSGLVRWNWD